MNPSHASRISLLAACLALPACASTAEVRSLANRTGAFVQSLNVGTGEFVEAQNQLNEANEAHLERLASYGARDRAVLLQQRAVWTNQRLTPRLTAHDRIQSVTAADIVGTLSVHSTTPAQIQNSSASGYTTALAALVDVSTRPSTTAAIGEMISFGQQVRQAYRQLREDAAKDGATTEGAAATADNAASTNAASTDAANIPQ